MSQFAGIDIGQGHTYSCVFDMESRTFHYPNASLSLPETLQWLQSFKNLKGGCIDGPPNPNTGELERKLLPNTGLNANRRLTEFQIGIGGCYSTRNVRPERGASNYWMQSSFDLFALLSEAFRWTIDKGNGGGQLIETHPTYAFKALLGCNRSESHGIQRFRLDPQSMLRRKHSQAGHNQRIELLSALCDESEIVITDDLRQRWNQRIDWVDAAICAFMSYWQQTGNPQLESPGDLDEGAIFLRIVQGGFEVTAAGPARRGEARRPARNRIREYPLNGVPTPANAIILRLGDTDQLNQLDTIDTVIASQDLEEFWFPCASNVMNDLETNLQLVDGRLFLAWGGNLRLQLEVTEVRRMAIPVPYPSMNESPWPTFYKHFFWLRVGDSIEIDSHEFYVNRANEWTQGFGRGQTALLWAIVPQNEGQDQ